MPCPALPYGCVCRGWYVDGTLYEIALVVMASYLAYLLGEVAGMSGIVALFFSGGRAVARPASGSVGRGRWSQPYLAVVRCLGVG